MEKGQYRNILALFSLIHGVPMNKLIYWITSVIAKNKVEETIKQPDITKLLLKHSKLIAQALITLEPLISDIKKLPQ